MMAIYSGILLGQEKGFIGVVKEEVLSVGIDTCGILWARLSGEKKRHSIVVMMSSLLVELQCCRREGVDLSSN